MTPGMAVTAKTKVGTIKVTALGPLTRAYTWEGATRSLEMIPRGERWYGSMGLYFPGPGDHWKIHNGITRAVVEEGQRTFKSVAEFQRFVKERKWLTYVYRNDGLMVGWDKVLDRRQLNVEVWQIVINGRKPKKLPGATDSAITLSKVPLKASPLLDAVNAGNLTAVTRELQKGQDPNVVDSTGNSPIAIAIRNGKPAIVAALLAAKVDANGVDADGRSLLHLAVGYQQIPIAKLLLAHGAKVDARETKGLSDGQTPLFTAIVFGDLEMVKLLLDSGADPNVEDARFEAPINYAISMASDKTPALQIARLLLDRKADVNHRGWDGVTPLILASSSGNLSLVKLLVERGANVNARFDAGRKIYQMGRFSASSAKETAALEKFGQTAKLDTLHEDGLGPLDVSSSEEIKNFLISKGAKSFQVEAEKRTEELYKLLGGR